MGIRSETALRSLLDNLTLVEYDAWGSSEAQSLPVQSADPVSHSMVADQLVRAVVEAESSLSRHTGSLRELFMKPYMWCIVLDLYWFSYLEFFGLLD